MLDELYVDDAAVVAHRASSHFAAYLARIGDLAERTAFLLHPADLGEGQGDKTGPRLKDLLGKPA